MKKTFTVILCAAMLTAMAGCASRSGRFAAGSSYLAEEYPAQALTTVAEHLADTISSIYPPGHTTFFLNQSHNPNDELGPAIETALRARGFTLAPEKDEQTLTLVYVLDRVDEESWYSRLTISDDLVLTRTWRLAGDDLEMEAATIRGVPTESAHGQ